MSKTRNCSVDIFRYICALLITAIHTSLFTDINDGLGYIFTTVLPRIAVPFFMAVAGYFYIKKLEEGKKPFFDYIKRILITYSIWSVIYYISDFISWGHTSIKGYIVNCLMSFFISGSHYHFWFFPALIFSVCAVTLLYKLKLKAWIMPLSIILYIIGCLGCAYYEITVNIPYSQYIFDEEIFYFLRHYLFLGFPFFGSGYAIGKLREKSSEFSNKKHLIITLVCVILWILEIVAVVWAGLERDIVLTLFLYPLVVAIILFLFKNPMPGWDSASQKCRILANFTYYAHPLLIEIICGFTTPAPTLLFISVSAAAVLLALGIYKLNNRYLNILVN